MDRIRKRGQVATPVKCLDRNVAQDASSKRSGWLGQSAAMPQKPGTGASLRLSHQPPGPLPALTVMRNLAIKARLVPPFLGTVATFGSGYLVAAG